RPRPALESVNGHRASNAGSDHNGNENPVVFFALDNNRLRPRFGSSLLIFYTIASNKPRWQ
ncbi:MAG: hypothetical protein CMF19_07055, partial [Idiomarinaceae bacterium]|nr:hypothetical protein [Idiomarinaceae bacterium]